MSATEELVSIRVIGTVSHAGRITLVQRETATTEECAEALRQLSDADLQRLRKLGRLRALGLKSVDGRDLLHEAIVRMLEGKRPWPRDVPLIAFLLETMRSIASDHWRRQEAAVVVPESEAHANLERGVSAVAIAVDKSTDPEASATAADALARIEEMFKGDDDALAVIDGMVSGNSPGEIQKENTMNETRYATTKRRIRRGLNRFSEKEGELL